MSERLAGFGNYLYSDPKGLGIEEIQIRTEESRVYSVVSRPGDEDILRVQWIVILSIFKDIFSV